MNIEFIVMLEYLFDELVKNTQCSVEFFDEQVWINKNKYEKIQESKRAVQGMNGMVMQTCAHESMVLLTSLQCNMQTTTINAKLKNVSCMNTVCIC